jgi:O-methyltransferase
MRLNARTLTSGLRSPRTMPVRQRVVLRTPLRALRTLRQELASSKELYDLGPTLDKVRPYSMVGEKELAHHGGLVKRVLAEGIAGDFVECGVWRGGASFLVADILRQAGLDDRQVWLFDSFEGHRPPEERDGQAALDYARDTDSPYYFDNCRVAVEDVRRTAHELQLAPYCEIVKGWFDETLPVWRERIGPIALLRLDCDWYASVRCCLDTLYDQVADGGLVVFDDYFDYEGCVSAVYEFLAERRLTHRLETAHRLAFFRKA